MNIGEKIKQLRTEKNLTQPQLAEAIGIEQSYLSKLENDKSIPSAEIFQAILKAFVIDVGSFLEEIDEKIIHRQLRQIPEVANYLNAGVAYKIHNIKKWLFSSATACVIGLTLIVAGYKSLLFSNIQYEYASDGVLLAGEPVDFIVHWDRYEARDSCTYAISDACQKKSEELAAKAKAMKVRYKVDTILINENQGQYIYKNIKSGFRAYEFKRINIVPRVENSYLILLGTLLTFGGIFGFFIEFRLRRI
jgi:transcriptional regulator with XRE-family HTH domain